MVQLPVSSIGVWIPESFPGPTLGAVMELGVGWGAYSLFKAEWDTGPHDLHGPGTWHRTDVIHLYDEPLTGLTFTIDTTW